MNIKKRTEENQADPMCRNRLAKSGVWAGLILAAGATFVFENPEVCLLSGGALLLPAVFFGTKGDRRIALIAILTVTASIGYFLYEKRNKTTPSLESSEKEALRKTLLAGYDAMMISDYDALLNLMTDDAKLYAVDGSVIDRSKLQGLARNVREQHHARPTDSDGETFSAFLRKREAWAKQAKETTVFQSFEFRGETAVVTTLDRGTPGEIETSVYTFRKEGATWKLQEERSSRKPEEQNNE